VPGIVRRVLRTVVDDDLFEIERRHAFEACDIDANLVGVRTPLVVRVDAAVSAEMMLGDLGIEAVGGELVAPCVMMKFSGVDVTATAPRIRQIEQVQRLADANPLVSVAVNLTAPQWQAPLRVTGSEEPVSVMR
jgi:hypothetical protein